LLLIWVAEIITGRGDYKLQKQLPRWGQWIGTATGTNNAMLILNIDKDRTNEGTIYFQDNDKSLSSMKGSVEFIDNGEGIVGEITKLTTFGANSNREEVIPKTAQLILTGMTLDQMEGTWRADNGQCGEFNINIRESTESQVKAEVIDWDDYLSFAIKSKRTTSSFIFRGQPDSKYPLRTSFHRTARRDLTRYSLEDMSTLNNYLANSNHGQFNLSDPKEFAALLSLAQHHGYPTPLLDWSRSALVAAFFAFRTVKPEDSDGFVRVYVFDLDNWTTYGQGFKSISMDEHRISVTPIEVFSQGNSRSLPQQSLFTFTNITDIERWITIHEKPGVEIIKAYDIRKSSRQLAMKDLENMNISSAALFPGLDGSFEALKEKSFIN